MFRRMGELLVECGELDAPTLEGILKEQRRHYRPFGRIAAEMFGVDEWAIWRAWAEQYSACCPTIDLKGQEFDARISSLVAPEEIWKFRSLPLRMHDGDVVMVTAKPYLARALAFVDIRLNEPTVLWLTSVEQLEQAIITRYGRVLPAELLGGRSGAGSGPVTKSA